MNYNPFLVLGAVTVIALPSVPAQAVTLDGSFDWLAEGIDNQPGSTFSGNTFGGSVSFAFEKDPFQKGSIVFEITSFNGDILDEPIPPAPSSSFEITDAAFGKNWELQSFAFQSTDSSSNGRVDFINPKDASKSYFIQVGGERTTFEPLPNTLKLDQGPPPISVPEPLTILGSFLTLGIGVAFKRAFKTKVSGVSG
jgi:hypothetical protein